MWKYYELLSSKSLDELQSLREGVELGSLHPKAVKQALAFEITARFYDESIAESAQIEFEKVFAQREMPSEIATKEFDSGVWICKVLQDGGLCSSPPSQARRDIQAGALKIDQQKIVDENLKLTSGEYIIQIGKRRFLKAIIR